MTLSAAGQTYTAGRFVFNTPGPYLDEQLEAAAQMHPGTKFTAEDLAAAASGWWIRATSTT